MRKQILLLCLVFLSCRNLIIVATDFKKLKAVIYRHYPSFEIADKETYTKDCDEEEKNKESDEKKSDALLIKKFLANKFGENNVSYDSSSDAYQIFDIKNIIANSNDKRHWTFVVVEEEQKLILEKFIPKELL